MTGLAGSHRRYNPLLDEWVLVSPRRLERPWQGQTEPGASESLPAYDPGCYLCPGNERANGRRNPAYAETFAFDNDFPSLDDRPAAIPSRRVAPDELLRAEPESGACRVLCFSPRHDLTLARMPLPAVRRVVDAWATEVAELGARDGIRHVQVFENRGAMMGCSNPHPHGQVWATGQVPTGPARRQLSQRRYYERHGRDLLGDYLARELQAQERLVLRNDHWVALAPFWAVWPFETLLLPVRPVSHLTGLEGEERDALADVLGRLTRRYDNLFRCPFPYSMAWHGRPLDGEFRPYWRLHATFFPPLLRSATIRKFVVGYELAAEPQRDLTAEQAAERLRATPDTHYLETTPDRTPTEAHR
jgi:UDPglucose--hexose-1-phosphate uridylyltransferase